MRKQILAVEAATAAGLARVMDTMQLRRVGALVLLAATILAMSAAAPSSSVMAAGGLVAVGPADPADGFPMWYRDSNGISLQRCMDPNNALCAFAPPFDFDATQPIAFPTNFPGEAFYQLASGTGTGAGGLSGFWEGALEATFGTGIPTAGDQVTFSRIRIRVDNLPVPGATYTVVHPYGTNAFPNVGAGVKGINFTRDIGLAPGVFTGAMAGDVGPWLRWDPNVLPAAPAGYIGDPNVVHAVVGGVNTFFRIVGPAVAGGPDVTVLETSLFSLMGQLSTVGGISPARATYSRPTAAGGTIAAFASTQPGQGVQASGTGLTTTALQAAAGGGNYYALLDFTGAPPASLTFTNVSDVPVTSRTVALKDEVTVTGVQYDTVTSTLTVWATSSDLVGPVTLTAEGFGTLSAGTLTVLNVYPPPPSVTVTSSAGGSDTLITKVFRGTLPPQAFPGLNQTVIHGAAVTLDGSASTGTITAHSWTQTAGTPVALTGNNTPIATFTAPNVDGVLTFTLTTTGPGGSSSVPVNVTVRPPAPVANAGADQTVVQAAAVTLSGAASTGAITTYSWAQTAGTPVALTGNNTATATFTAPNGDGVLTFTLTTTGPGGTTTDTVIVTVLSPPPVANAGIDQIAIRGATVTLSGAASTGAITTYSWAQTAGTPVTLAGGNTVTATFTAPNVDGVLTLTLTTTGPGGTSSDTISVTVQPPAPVANAGADQTVPQSRLVTLNGSGTVGATSYSWRQTGGTPAVGLTGANTANPTFTFPDQYTVLTFELTATNASGSTIDTVTITAIPDVITVTKAEYRAGGRWLVTGTSTMPGPSTITIRLTAASGGTLVGTAQVDDRGLWQFQAGASPVALGPDNRIDVTSSRGGSRLGVATVSR